LTLRFSLTESVANRLRPPVGIAALVSKESSGEHDYPVSGDFEIRVPGLSFDHCVSQCMSEVVGNVVGTLEVDISPNLRLSRGYPAGQITTTDPSPSELANSQVSTDTEALGQQSSTHHVHSMADRSHDVSPLSERSDQVKTDSFLLVNPPYENIGVTESVSSASVTLSIAGLAGQCRQYGRHVELLDLNVVQDWQGAYEQALARVRPDVVGITFATPLVGIASELGKIAQAYDSYVIGGGPHASAMPRQCITAGGFDAIAMGEGDNPFEHLLTTQEVNGCPGWVTSRTLIPQAAEPYPDLDALPFAAVDLFDPNDYLYPERACRANPVCLVETSRGCYARCTFCNKNIFGWKIRKKSASRVVDEMEFILESGYREIHIADDLFTAHYQHARQVCAEIQQRGLEFPWVPRSGLRVDRVKPDLLEAMRDAGCYHIPFGIESGVQETLNSINKGITIEQIEKAVEMVQLAEMETTGYFMVGIPGESTAAMQKTLDFAVGLDLDFVKIGICVPLPGTPMFTMAKEQGLLRTEDWNLYTYSTPPWELCTAPEMSEESLQGLAVGG
jgi:anaerobic magnesium-protoporphyrin IX monomethyl ester cyclase